MTQPLTQFIFCTSQKDGFAKSIGATCDIHVVKKDYFDNNERLAEKYEAYENAHRNDVIDKIDIFAPEETIIAQLNSEPNFSFSQKLHDLMN